MFCRMQLNIRESSYISRNVETLLRQSTSCQYDLILDDIQLFPKYAKRKTGNSFDNAFGQERYQNLFNKQPKQKFIMWY